MRRSRFLLVMGLACVINSGSLTLAMAEGKPSTDAKQSREKFAKLLLAERSPKTSDKTPKATKPATKPRGAVVNAFGSTRVHLP